MEFPFLREQIYSLGSLRKFADTLHLARTQDCRFSDHVRSNDLAWAKLWNEELVPLKHYANWKKFGDEMEFRISAAGHHGPDVEILSPGLRTSFQITTAYPAWGGDGGKTRRFVNLALSRNGLAWGAGGESRDKRSAEFKSVPVVVSNQARLEACKAGFLKALVGKENKAVTAHTLLIYARGFLIELIDAGFEDVLRPLAENRIANSDQLKRYCRIAVLDAELPGEGNVFEITN